MLLARPEAGTDAPYPPPAPVARTLAASLRASLAALCRHFIADPGARRTLLEAVAGARAACRVVLEHERVWRVRPG